MEWKLIIFQVFLMIINGSIRSFANVQSHQISQPSKNDKSENSWKKLLPKSILSVKMFSLGGRGSKVNQSD